MFYVKPRQKKTKELEFLHTFKTSGFFKDYCQKNNGNSFFIEEPYTGFGYPDLVFLTWNRNLEHMWNEERNKLKLNDIKIAQHLYNSDSCKSLQDISKELGFIERDLNKILSRLYAARIIDNVKNLWKLRKLTDIFFIENIITIEAKLKNWRTALLQASNNEYFSSEVFTLYPERIINEKLLKSYINTKIGIISYDQKYKIVKQANRKKLPITINGWQFNELIGRMLWKKN